jgi:hypothetical protein
VVEQLMLKWVVIKHLSSLENYMKAGNYLAVSGETVKCEACSGKAGGVEAGSRR